MKNLAILLVLIPSGFYTSCTPKEVREILPEDVKLVAAISDTNEVIHLGDTIKITLTVPNSLNTNLGTHQIQSLQRGFFRMFASRIDTANSRAINMASPNIWSSNGTYVDYILSNTNMPFGITIYLKPPEKGLYYFEVTPQAGMFNYNGNSRANFFVNFNPTNSHIRLISDKISGQAFFDAVTQQINEGFGFYAFRVN